jgi:hypothetical protein
MQVKPKKAQLSVILILAVLILMVVFVVILLVIQADDTETIGSVGSFEPVRAEVLNCLESSFEQAISMSARQGGIIFSAQGGITQLSQHHFLQESPGSQYYVPFITDETVYFSDMFPFDCENPYGTDTIPHLYEQANCDKDYSFSTQIRYLPPLRGLRATIMARNIKAFLNGESGVEFCLPSENVGLVSEDFEILESSEPRVEVFLSESGMLARLDYEVTLRRVGTGETRTLTGFESFVPLRLYEMLDFLEEHIYNDSSIATFEPGGSRDEMIVGLIRNPMPSSNPGDDIIFVKDSRHYVAGEEFVFQVARRNREPIVHAMPKLQDPSGNVVNIVNISLYLSSSNSQFEQAATYIYENYSQPACDLDLLRESLRTLFYETGIVAATDPDGHNLNVADNIDESNCHFPQGTPGLKQPFVTAFIETEHGKESSVEYFLI